MVAELTEVVRGLVTGLTSALASAAERSAEKLIDSDPQGLGKDFIRSVRRTTCQPPNCENCSCADSKQWWDVHSRTSNCSVNACMSVI